MILSSEFLEKPLNYVIVSLSGIEPDVKSFTIRKGEVSPEPVDIVED